jgi:hypothetical protein
MYDVSPTESFDLTPTMASMTREGAVPDPECEAAFRTGVGEVRVDQVFHPVATLRRVTKYGAAYGLKFRASQLILITALHGVKRQDVVDAAMAYAV